MVLAVNEIISPTILLLTNDKETKSVISQDDGLSGYKFLFASFDDDIFNQLNGHTPHLAVIDSSCNGFFNKEITNAIKQRYDIPIILLIDPDDFSHLKQATQSTVDSVFTKPVQTSQLSISIQFHLLLMEQDRNRICSPRSYNVVRQDIKEHQPVSVPVPATNEYSHIMDKQDFIHKLKGLLGKLERENTVNACAKFEIQDTRLTGNPHGKRNSLNLLNNFTAHIQRQIRFGDILAKDFGYQYLILFPNLDKYTVSIVIKRILDSLAKLISELEYNGNLQVISGATVFDHNVDVSQIMEKVDMALEEASRMGEGAYIVHSYLDSRSEQNIKKVSYANIIHNSLKEDRFFLHYQPILSLKDNSITHYEALLRLQDNDGEFIQPWKIISAAEDNHQIKEIDIRVLDLVMKKLTALNLTQDSPNVSINLSGTHFGDEGLLEDICILIDYYGIDPSQLVFEMTETAAVKDLDKASTFISRLKDLGCHFGLDDFGTGYASFSYLRALPVDYLKIDGTFVKEIINNPADQLFVKAIVDVAKGINVKTIAECVEDRETLDMLKSYGIDYAQGYYIGHPQPLALPEE